MGRKWLSGTRLTRLSCARPEGKEQASAEQEDDLGEDDSAPQSWKEQLLEVLFDVPPDGFERLARRLLREAGFVSAIVTGKSGDGGIDGIGVYRCS